MVVHVMSEDCFTCDAFDVLGDQRQLFSSNGLTNFGVGVVVGALSLRGREDPSSIPPLAGALRCRYVMALLNASLTVRPHHSQRYATPQTQNL